MTETIRKVCVYCASSRSAHADHRQAAERLGRILARNGSTLVYGGGSVGTMGAVANGALAEGGSVIGVLPRFMYDLEWGHTGLTELLLVDDMHARKRLMISEVDAIVALPGGSGTYEELLEAITWKRLGLHVHPIVLLNTRDAFDPFVALMDRVIDENFMHERHRAMWEVVERPEDVLGAIANAPVWSSEARGFAQL